jgi:hypothetical protein
MKSKNHAELSVACVLPAMAGLHSTTRKKRLAWNASRPPTHLRCRQQGFLQRLHAALPLLKAELPRHGQQRAGRPGRPSLIRAPPPPVHLGGRHKLDQRVQPAQELRAKLLSRRGLFKMWAWHGARCCLCLILRSPPNTAAALGNTAHTIVQFHTTNRATGLHMLHMPHGCTH